MKKKKKKQHQPAQLHQPVPQSVDSSFIPDDLVEGDCPLFSQRRIFTSKNTNHQYSFREHYLYFPFENSKSKFYSTLIPPASYQLEKRQDLKHFDFFSFVKSQSAINLYRFALKSKLCDDLLEYISDEIDVKAKEIFRQSIEESRKSKLLVNIPEVPQQHPIQPLFSKQYSECHFITLSFGAKKQSVSDPNLDQFLNWFNSLNDPLVSEVTHFDYKEKLHVVRRQLPVGKFDILDDVDQMLMFESVENSVCVRRYIQSLISKHHRKYGTKFKFSLNASPGYGKTRIKNIYHQFLLTDLDDITMLDPVEGPIFHKLVNSRRWNDQRLEYHRVIKTKFKEGILLGQNSNQSPPDIPFINVVTPGHLGRKKLWSDRGLYDLVIDTTNKVFVLNKLIRNQLIEIIYDEIYNSLNYT
jgi:hypothetical protein